MFARLTQECDDCYTLRAQLLRACTYHEGWLDGHGERDPDIDYLLAEVERLQRVVNTVPDLLDWMKRYRGGDPALDPEEYWIRSEDTANALAALTEGGES